MFSSRSEVINQRINKADVISARTVPMVLRALESRVTHILRHRRAIREHGNETLCFGHPIEAGVVHLAPTAGKETMEIEHDRVCLGSIVGSRQIVVKGPVRSVIDQ
jgi:hypothetical protein